MRNSPKITTSRPDLWRGILIDGASWLWRVFADIGMLTGLTVCSVAVFLLHLRWDLAISFVLLGVIIVLFAGTWRRACTEKDTLDPEWRTK